MALYAAYASNLDVAQMRRRCPHSPVRGSGWVRGWRLTFGGEDRGWDGALATVVEDPGHAVFVLLYDLSAADEARLDDWEGRALDLYTRIRVRVSTLEGDLLAWTYVLNGYEGGLPSADYLELVAAAAEAAAAPADYVAALRAHPVQERPA